MGVFSSSSPHLATWLLWPLALLPPDCCLSAAAALWLFPFDSLLFCSRKKMYFLSIRSLPWRPFASECWRGVWEHRCSHRCWHLSLGAEPEGTKALSPSGPCHSPCFCVPSARPLCPSRQWATTSTTPGKEGAAGHSWSLPGRSTRVMLVKAVLGLACSCCQGWDVTWLAAVWGAES